jgi:hypothetical protein
MLEALLSTDIILDKRSGSWPIKYAVEFRSPTSKKTAINNVVLKTKP